MRNGDYWEDSGQVFVTGGMRYGLTANCRTICMGSVVDKALQGEQGKGVTPEGGHLPIPTKNVTDNLSLCHVCNGPIFRKRANSCFCSNKCRQKFYRKSRGKQLALVGVT